MKDLAVSNVLAVVLLFSIVAAGAGVMTVFLAEEVTKAAESAPQVSFQESFSPHYLYHAGGDVLTKSEVRVFAGSSDITDKTMIRGEEWDIWKTGDALYLGAHQTDEITVVGRTSHGREVLLYEGQKKY